MFVLANFLNAFAQLLTWVLDLMIWLVIIRALLSWVSPDPGNPIVQIIEKLTEPVLHPFRLLVPPFKMGIDISPLLALLVLVFLKSFLISTLLGLAARLQ